MLIQAASSYVSLCTHVCPAHMFIAMNTIPALHGCAWLSPISQGSNTVLRVAALSGSLSLLQFFFSFSDFSPVATQSLYPNVIVRIRHSLSWWRPKLPVKVHGDLIEKAVLRGASSRLQGFFTLCIKPPCPHTIAVKCMAIFSFSESLLPRKWIGKFHTIAAEAPWKISNNIKSVLNFEKEYLVLYAAFHFTPASWIICGLLACQFIFL